MLGAGTSLIAHELGHVSAALVVGGRPSVGFDKGRPTVYPGIRSDLQPHRQLVFSSAGLAVQAVLDEVLLDIPHERSGPFERGILAGGIGTALFYVTAGRNGAVSDVSYIAETSGLGKTAVSLMVGGVAALHALRIHHLPRYTHFFTLPAADGGVRVGVTMEVQ